MVVILLSSPLEPQFDTKVIPDKKGSLMAGGFLLAYSRMSNKEPLVLFMYKPA